MIQKEYFKTISTRELLTYRRAFWCKYPRFEGDKENEYWDGGFKGYQIDYESLYEELSYRPHVSSGRESKLMRELRAKYHMSEKEIRDIPKYRKMLADAQKSETKPKEQEKELHPIVKGVCVKF